MARFLFLERLTPNVFGKGCTIDGSRLSLKQTSSYSLGSLKSSQPYSFMSSFFKENKATKIYSLSNWTLSRIALAILAEAFAWLMSISSWSFCFFSYFFDDLFFRGLLNAMPLSMLSLDTWGGKLFWMESGELVASLNTWDCFLCLCLLLLHVLTHEGPKLLPFWHFFQLFSIRTEDEWVLLGMLCLVQPFRLLQNISKRSLRLAKTHNICKSNDELGHLCVDCASPGLQASIWSTFVTFSRAMALKWLVMQSQKAIFF